MTHSRTSTAAILACMLLISTWLAVALYKLPGFLRPMMGLTGMLDPTTSGPVAYALLLILASVIFCRKAGKWSRTKRASWIGGIVIGSLPFPFTMLSFLHAVSRHGFGILTDGTFWWGAWFVPVAVLGLPALVAGIGAGAVWAWWRR